MMGNLGICPNFGKWIGCKFEPRYDKGPVESPAAGIKYTGSNLEGALEAHRRVTYVRDICIRCGKTIERETK